MFVLVWLNFRDLNYLAGFCRTFLVKLVNTKLYRIKLWRWKYCRIPSNSGLKWYFTNSRKINFCAPKCAKNGLFRALLIFAHSCWAKINGIKVCSECLLVAVFAANLTQIWHASFPYMFCFFVFFFFNFDPQQIMFLLMFHFVKLDPWN